METIAKSLEKILIDLESIGGIEFSAIVSRQGLLMGSKTNNRNLNCDTFAALTATLFSSAESTTTRLSKQKPRSIIVQTEDKHLITYAATPEALIVVLVGKSDAISSILNELKISAERVRNFI
jgi:predicted regulator of Ras-like GTPase activity (Roadblock/LC7/MglB family)